MFKSIGTVCFFVKDGQVLLAEFEYPDGNRFWNGIGGVVDEGETPSEAVIREIGEETKLKLSQTDIIEATVITVGSLELHVFVAHAWSGELIAIDPTLKQFRWFTFKSIPYEQMHPGNDSWLPAVLQSSSRG